LAAAVDQLRTWEYRHPFSFYLVLTVWSIVLGCAIAAVLVSGFTSYVIASLLIGSLSTVWIGSLTIVRTELFGNYRMELEQLEPEESQVRYWIEL
jgi:hypothetical protein